jgi:hypothetical protein
MIHSLFIYDVEMDNFLTFNCGEDRIPLEAFWDRNDKKFFGILCTVIKNENKGADGEKMDHHKP